MFNRKKYILVIVLIGVLSVAAIVLNALFGKSEYWLWIALVAMTAFTVLRTRMFAPLQLFGTKFTMLVDYDLDVEEACRLAKEGADNAPTEKIAAIYTMYLGMGLYYKGDYDAAIRTFNGIRLDKLDGVYHVLIVAFICYAEFELGDEAAFRQGLERLRGIQSGITPKYQGYAANYLEILEALDKLALDPEHYRAVMDKHFNRDDGYISTKLIHQYRLALYDRQVGDLAAMDQKLAFVIANGKNHHTALRARALFQGTVNPDDYVIRPADEEPTPADPSLIETQKPEADEDKPEGE